MLAAEDGRIINMASTAGLKGYARVAAYCAAKHGVIGLTRALAAETKRTRRHRERRLSRLHRGHADAGRGDRECRARDRQVRSRRARASGQSFADAARS